MVPVEAEASAEDSPEERLATEQESARSDGLDDAQGEAVRDCSVAADSFLQELNTNR